MTLASLLDAELAYGDLPLLDHAQLTVQEGERIGLIGRNGSGKSSLLKAMAGLAELDRGSVNVRDGLRILYVPQEPEFKCAPTLRDALLLEAHVAAMPEDAARWQFEARLTEWMHRLQVDGHTDPASLSGGGRKRAALALAMAQNPDLLLLDEPTNHLDVAGIALLEAALIDKHAPTCMVITHDRAFLDRVATRIVELDRGHLRDYPGNYAAFESRKATELLAEEKAARRFDKFWAQEEAWIRKGIEARRTRNAGRVTRLEQLRNERAARRTQVGTIKLEVDASTRSGKLVAELEHVSKAFGAQGVVRDFSARILRGDRIGLVGANGAGKSTLLKLILGEAVPDQGQIRRGVQLSVAYFDQMRAALDPERTVAQTIAPGSEWIEIGGSRKHVMSYLGDFLFPPRRAQAPVKTLSGGERNRLLLARLFAQPANLLVMDEPTNDLDIESLELLEDTLRDYSGTLLLVSHDRRFLDNVVTQVWAAEGDGVWREYIGGYSDWQAQRPKTVDQTTPEPSKPQPKRPSAARTKLSYKEQRALESLPAEIESLEAEQAELIARMSAPNYHRAGPEAIKANQQRARDIEALLTEKYQYWAQLDHTQSNH